MKLCRTSAVLAGTLLLALGSSAFAQSGGPTQDPSVAQLAAVKASQARPAQARSARRQAARLQARPSPCSLYKCQRVVLLGITY